MNVVETELQPKNSVFCCNVAVFEITVLGFNSKESLSKIFCEYNPERVIVIINVASKSAFRTAGKVLAECVELTESPLCGGRCTVDSLGGDF